MMAALAYRAVVAVDRLFGGNPIEDPFLDTSGPADANPLDVVDPAWGLPSGHEDFPARVVEQTARRTSCVSCDDTGFVITHEDGAGYRPCFRCPSQGDAA